jgi:RNA polymerase sigma-70 factor (ECF subfamily)
MPPTEKHIDESILLRLKNGDEKAFDMIFWKFNPMIYNFVNSILFNKSLAEDITQQVFLKIWEKRATINVEKSFSSYLFTIARNFVYQETERLVYENKFISFYKANENELDNSTFEKIDAGFIESFINEVIAQLPEKQQKVFDLSRRKGYSNREIAKELNITEKAVENHVYRTLQFLKEKMKKHFIFLAFIFLSQQV